MKPILRVFFLLVAFVFSSRPAGANVREGGDTLPAAGDTTILHLKFTNLKAVNSVVHIALYRDRVDFLGPEPFHSMKVETRSVSEIETVVHLPAGEYAIAVFQDLNANGDLDKNFIGYPKEPFGFSRNFVPRISKPSWEDASFKLESLRRLEIEMIR